MQLIVGLGNPGSKYANTRHNLGFILLDKLCQKFQLEKKFQAETAKVELSGKSLHCLKPQTYMNLSGQSVSSFVNYYQIEPKNILVVHDELDLDFGVVRLKFGGGEGGHNGLKSISEALGTKDYMRLRLGIGKPQAGNLIPIEDWVLSRFKSEEISTLEEVLIKSNSAVKSVAELGFSKAQSLVNPKSC